MPEEFLIQPQPTAAPLAVEVLENIVYQPDTVGAMFDCTYYAVANLHLLMGMEPPTVERMKLLWQPHNANEGVTTPEALAIMCELNMPALVAISFIPHGLTAKDVLPPLLDDGWFLLLGVSFVGEVTERGAALVNDPQLVGMKMWAAHSVVPYGYDEDGLDVIVGWHGHPVTKIKWNTMPALDWKKLQDQQIGISRDFVMVKPHRKGN